MKAQEILKSIAITFAFATIIEQFTTSARGEEPIESVTNPPAIQIELPTIHQSSLLRIATNSPSIERHSFSEFQNIRPEIEQRSIPATPFVKKLPQPSGTMPTSFSHAQLVAMVSPATVSGNKMIVKLALKNGMDKKIESARAVVFVSDDQGKLVAQSAKWVIGAQRSTDGNSLGLASGATNVFHFILNAEKPVISTNLSTKVLFNSVILDGGRPADPRTAVRVEPATD
jgi:hypothetical protein